MEAAQNEYFTPRPFAVHKQYDDATKTYSFVPELMRPPPLRLGVILGDLVHNLRSTLDHLVWQAVVRQGDVEPTTQHQFPICDDESSWPAASKRRLKGVAAVDQEAIREVQPFRGQLSPPPVTPPNLQ